MSALLIAVTILAALCVISSSVCILNRLHWTTHTRGYAHFLGYGLSHVVLAGGALLAAIDAAHGVLSLAGVIVVLASAGLILFDRRRPRR
jgi:hypothetical protein